MIQFWDCAKGTWVKVWSKAEVLRHGWAWHAGTAPAMLALALNCDAPPAVAYGGPLPPLPVHETPYEQPAPPWYPPAYSALPPEMLLPPAMPVPLQGLPIPWGDVGVTPGLVSQETAPVEHKHHRHWWDCMTPSGPPAEVPEPAALWVLLVGLVGVRLVRRK